MRLTLLISDLLPPAALVAEAPRLPCLETLLARGDITRHEGGRLEEALLQCFGASTAATAALTWLADGGEAGADTWLRADPVHLHLHRDHLQLHDAALLHPTATEANALVESLNRHLEQDGLSLIAPHPTRWYLHLGEEPAPVTTPLWRMGGASVYEHLPQNTAQRNWRALQNELQMLLFDHPVNQVRQARGALPINSLWFWGGGALPTRAAPPVFTEIVADMPLARGLAQYAGLPAVSLPQHFSALAATTEQVLVVLDSPSQAVAQHDAAAWVATMQRIEADWLKPATAALTQGKLASLRCYLVNAQMTTEVIANRWSMWRL
ncbi:MAG: hypothetical protein JNM52_02120, partial [Betaproteobacteria bacterium]|nr:hypothetical protein [Betaproteobacteria bacterium]